MKKELLNRVVINPKIMAGKPVIRGTRIPVELILKKLGQNIDFQEILEDFPRLKIEDIKAALELYISRGAEFVLSEVAGMIGKNLRDSSANKPEFFMKNILLP
ncbi:DUF433 domain-containing protein, partial [Candidatus Poribacteria bacterium]|nr:DUF433 domain-containing protein [Candidatus Poribacteria bacterium]